MDDVVDVEVEELDDVDEVDEVDDVDVDDLSLDGAEVAAAADLLSERESVR